MELLIKSKTHGDKILYYDEEDQVVVLGYRWSLNKRGNTFYAIAKTGGRKNHKEYKLHRLIMQVVDPNIKVDHIDHNGLNNTRVNLRIVSHSQNMYNSAVSKNNKTGYKGVHFHKKRNKYVAIISCSGNAEHLGLFNSASEAALAYNEAATKYFGEYAFLNIIRAEEVVLHKQHRLANIRRDNLTGFKGVSLPKKRKRFVATICFNKKNIYIGSYVTAIEAAKAYNEKAIDLYGREAIINNI